MARSTIERMCLRFVAVAALSFVSFDAAWSQSTCSSFNLTGGVASGIYTDLNIPINGKPSYSTTVDDVVYVVIFDEDDARRKLREAGGEEGGTEALADDLDGDVLLDAHTMAGDAVRRAEHARDRSLASCSNGFWFNFLGVNYTTYPWYLTPDCADHPADITEGWFVVACDGCDPVATNVTIDCAATVSTSSSASDSGTTASGGASGRSSSDRGVITSSTSQTSPSPVVATSAPNSDSSTLTGDGDSSSTSGSLTAEVNSSVSPAPTPESTPPTSGSVGTPVVSASTPSPASAPAATEGTSSESSGVTVTAGGVLARVVVSATIAVFAATSPFLVGS